MSAQTIAPPRPIQRSARRLPVREFGSAHLVGICGSGMKALAELLTDFGWTVTGSDLQTPGPAMAAMQSRGLRVHWGHHDRFLPRGVDVLVYSPAVGPANPERQRAAKLGVPQMSYSRMLGYLMQSRTGVSVAGTHGKSTTTAMTATILADSGLSPSAVVGAELCGFGLSGWGGEGELLVVESCEYQRSFLELHPKYAAVLGIEPDHFDYYRSFADARSAFAEFAGQVASDGILAVRGDCAASIEAARSASAAVVTFSTVPGADWWATDLRRTERGTRFRVFYDGAFFTEINLQVPGVHNVLNALAATALCHEIGVPARDIRESLREFRGVRRRFEFVGSWRGITLIDDYAHHPTAVRATLETVRERFGDRRVWCAFQPHQVSRTTALMDEFAASFRAADEVLVAPVFAARETVAGDRDQRSEVRSQRSGVRSQESGVRSQGSRVSSAKPADSAPRDRAGYSPLTTHPSPFTPHPSPITAAEQLAERTAAHGPRARFVPSLDQIIATLEDEARPGDVLVTMGAGDIDRVHHAFTRRLQRHHPPR